VVLIWFLTMKRTRDMVSGWIYMDTPLHGLQGGNRDSCGWMVGGAGRLGHIMTDL
jgi:hypothetical protein